MVIWHLSWRVQYGFPSRVTRDQNVWKLKTTWNLCFTTSSSTERVYKSNSSHRHPFFSGLTIALLKDLSCLSLSLVFTIDPQYFWKEKIKLKQGEQWVIYIRFGTLPVWSITLCIVCWLILWVNKYYGKVLHNWTLNVHDSHRFVDFSTLRQYH